MCSISKLPKIFTYLQVTYIVFSCPQSTPTNGHQDYKQTNGKLNTSAGNTPFRRVRDEEIEIDERVKNNSFEAKVS